jgi:tripartite-type tricarboxylate transporter receptor subunit TctC
LATPPSPLTVNQSLYPRLGYDPAAFVPVTVMAQLPNVLMLHSKIPATNVAELIAYAKANPGKLTYASAGVGSGIHLAAEYFRFQAGIEMTHVPYKGSAPALTDLVGGHVAIYFSSLPPAIALVKEGKLRALAVTGPARSPIFPELPTVAEAALPGFEAVLHYGIVAPAGTPRPIVDKLNAALRSAVSTDEFRQKLAADGTEPLASTPEEYAADIDKEETKWSAIVKKSGAKAE